MCVRARRRHRTRRCMRAWAIRRLSRPCVQEPAMTTGCPSVLCPIDFSDASRTALCYAAAIADRFGARLILLTVDAPVLAEVSERTRWGWQSSAGTGRTPSLTEETEHELRRFYDETLTHTAPGAKTLEFR